jgi:hypothetical protein
MTVAELARILGGDVVGRAVHAPGPGLPPSDRSLIVGLSWQAPDGFMVISRIVDRATAREHVRKLIRASKAPLFGSAV